MQFEVLKKELLKKQYTWLITGVAGFIGSNLLETLLKLNQKIIGLDNFSTGSRNNINDVLDLVDASQRKNFYFYEGDICSFNVCKKITEGVDYVLHQAALGSVPRSIDAPALTNETNISGFLNILLASKESKVKRFVYASSSSVYGDSPRLPKVESHIGNPLSPYAVSKYANELYAKAFTNCYGIETIGLRYFNIFGPRQNPVGPYAAVIPLWIISLLKNYPVYINGDGKASRDFCYIDNAIQANLLAATVDNQEALNKVYNVTVGSQTTLNKLYEIISTYLTVTKFPIYRSARAGDIRHSLADISLSKKLLGYCPTFTIERGLQKTIEWYCSQKID